MKRIALIHAVQVAMPPVEEAFRQHWPETKRTNLLDDSLAADRESAGQLTPDLSQRIMSLAEYSAGAGADAVLFTCSAFGEAIAAAAHALPIPVLKPNEAMFDAALDIGGSIGMLATFAPAVASMEDEFRDLARRRGSAATVETLCVPGARAALLAGESEKHDNLIAEAAVKFAHCSAIMLAHFSMTSAAQRTQGLVGCTVLSAPVSAVLTLRSTFSKDKAR